MEGDNAMDQDDVRALYPQLGSALRDYMAQQLNTRTRMATGTRLTEGHEREESEEIPSGDLATMCKGVAINANPRRSYLDQQPYGDELLQTMRDAYDRYYGRSTPQPGGFVVYRISLLLSTIDRLLQGKQ